jgi:hypothetical protein
MDISPDFCRYFSRFLSMYLQISVHVSPDFYRYLSRFLSTSLTVGPSRDNLGHSFTSASRWLFTPVLCKPQHLPAATGRTLKVV